jgi:restriction system protein
LINYDETGTLQEFLISLKKDKYNCYPCAKIPDRFWDEFIEKIKKLSINGVKQILRLLLDAETYGSDEFRANHAAEFHRFSQSDENKSIDPKKSFKLNYSIMNDEGLHRMLRGKDAWEGLTWILNFLPIHPQKALDIIGDYIIAQGGYMPDDFLIGLDQVIMIINKRFIEVKHPKEILLALSPTEFELLIKELYARIGYTTEWTKPTRDGGKDIIATLEKPYSVDNIYIECKRYIRSELRIESVRAFAYTVLNDKMNKGILFCTGHIPKSLLDFDKRIKIINYEELNALLNSHWGDWLENLDILIAK